MLSVFGLRSTSDEMLKKGFGSFSALLRIFEDLWARGENYYISNALTLGIPSLPRLFNSRVGCGKQFVIDPRDGHRMPRTGVPHIFIVTAKGIHDLYVLVFLCLQTREVFVTESTLNPDSAWVCKQTEWFVEQTKDRERKPEMILHDRDVKFTKEFTKTVKDAGMKANPLPKGSPNLNGRCERFIGTIRWECLDKFIVFGKRHLDYLIDEFTTYYNTRRSHMERDHLPPIHEVPEEIETLTMDQIEVKSYVGGLVKSFARKAV